MTAFVLDAGAFVAYEREDQALGARLRLARDQGISLRTSAIVVAQVWRDPAGRQARLGQLLRAVDVRPVDQQLARRAGVLLGRAGRSDAVDATLVLLAEEGDQILTSDPADIRHLVAVARMPVGVISC